MAEVAPRTADPNQPRPKRRRVWVMGLVLCLGVCFLGVEAYTLSPSVRLAAVNVVSWFGPPAAPLLFRFGCEDRDEEVQAAAVRLLIREGPGAVPTLEQALSEPDARRRRTAAEILGSIGPAAARSVPALAGTAATDRDGSVRRAAVAALGAVRGGGNDRAILQALQTLLTDADPEIRLASLRSLHDFGPAAKSAVPILVKWLKDDDAGVREQAAEALGQIGPDAREAVPALRETLKDPVRHVRREAEEALEAIGEPTGPDKD